MIFINRHHVFHMQRSTLIPHQACLFFSTSRPYNNAVILIYIWGTVMVDITKQNWQNIPIVLWKGRLSPTLTLREKKKERKEKAFLSFGFTSEWEFNFSPLHSVVIYHPWRSGPGPQEVKRKCNRKRRRWTVWSPACKSSFFFLWVPATLEDEVLLLWEKTAERYTCHNIDT